MHISSMDHFDALRWRTLCASRHHAFSMLSVRLSTTSFIPFISAMAFLPFIADRARSRGRARSVTSALRSLLLGSLVKRTSRVGGEVLELGSGVLLLAGALLVRVVRWRVLDLLARLALGVRRLAAGVGCGHCGLWWMFGCLVLLW